MATITDCYYFEHNNDAHDNKHISTEVEQLYNTYQKLDKNVNTMTEEDFDSLLNIYNRLHMFTNDELHNEFAGGELLYIYSKYIFMQDNIKKLLIIE